MAKYILVICLLLAVQLTVVGFHTVVSPSMEDTLLVGDTLIVFIANYGWRFPFSRRTIIPGKAPRRGDMAIFEYPYDRTQEYLKRVVACGGDTVSITRKVLKINGNIVPLPGNAKHADPDILHSSRKRDHIPMTTVPVDSLFVLGDNRDFSHDSRLWGFLGEPQLRGKVVLVLWSLDPEVSWTQIGRKVRWNRIFKKIE